MKTASRPARRRQTPQTRSAVTSYTPSTDEDGRRVWTLRFPAPARMVSVNGNPSWRITAPIRKTWREAVYLHVTAAKLPTGLRRIRVDLELRFPTGGRRDAENYGANVGKPSVDALAQPIRTVRQGKPIVSVGYGMVPDDTAQYVDGPHITLGPSGRLAGAGFGEVVLTITDLSGDVVP